MKETTLCLCVRERDGRREVLLGLKKRRFGVGKYSGFGGKLDPDETVVEAAVRELWEECSLVIDAEALAPVGRLEFSFPARPDWDLIVNAFLVRQWEGEPVESEEMAPAWFAIDEMPYQKMWPDSELWMPQVFAGYTVSGEFVYNEDNETLAAERVVAEKA